MHNLDQTAAEFAQQLLALVETPVEDGHVTASKLEKVSTTMLWILQEQGPYAATLYALSRSGSENTSTKLTEEEFIMCAIASTFFLLTEDILGKTKSSTPNLEQIRKSRLNQCPLLNGFKRKAMNNIPQELQADFEDLLLAKSLFRQILTYTRFGARALTNIT